jgi:hypothetical protein
MVNARPPVTAYLRRFHHRSTLEGPFQDRGSSLLGAHTFLGRSVECWKGDEKVGVSRIGFRVLVCTAALVSVAGLSAEKAQAEDPPALAWESRYNQPYSRDLGKAVATDPAGNIYVTGAGTGYAGTLYTDDPDFLTVKYDPTGAEVWKALYGAFHFDFECSPHFQGTYETPEGISVDAAGNVYVTGNSRYGVSCGIHGEWYGSVHSVTVKYDPNGLQMWLAAMEGESAGMAVDEDGNVFVTGTLYEFDPWGYTTPVSYVTAKFDAFGQRH